ncbi:fibronectin type III domain-containing protein [Clostridium tarantellae]|uniref:Fibronectin type-III domain-containing protein n=1 Tax=Clostridium tarantellae TaxID=39493 RepID=A0A6I1MLP2_9CLOT|nr:carbohydrate binding domain-containing protein [Clostridium tarantellae]MPQ43152.1 hypothetical protein [Clostridium tarantellae]
MKRIFTTLLTMIIFVGILPIQVFATTNTEKGRVYYVDWSNGNDDNKGTSKRNAFKTLDKINSIEFEPGDKILFKSGEVWPGQLYIKGSGIESNPIIIDKYGEGPKPALIGGEEVQNVIYINNQEYVEYNNLDISADYDSPLERRGIYILAKDMGVINHIYLKNLELHDIRHNLKYTNNNSYKTTGGIFVQILGNTVPTKFDDLLIEGCTLKDLDRTGIQLLYSSWTNRGGLNSGTGRWYPSTNVKVKNNYLENIGGDGIIIQGTDGAVIERNTINGFAKRNQNITYNCAAWSHNADNTIFQFNEGMNGNSIMDGMPWDSDGYSNGTIFQYNYSHDNDGGAMLLISYGDSNSPSGVADARDAIFRYNISENDKFALITTTNPLGNNKIYNNVFYTGAGMNVNAFNTGSINHKEIGLYLSNNIFYVDEGGKLNGNWVGKYNYDNNIYYSKGSGIISALPNDFNMITEDPMFVNPGVGEDGYKLMSSSPAINAGKYIVDNGEMDYYGNELYNGLPDIGVNEYYDASVSHNNIINEEKIEINLFNDPGFESGKLAAQGIKNAWAGYGERNINSENAKTGNYCAQLGNKETGLNYEITGLKSNTTYEATIYAKIENINGPKATMAVQKFLDSSQGKETIVIDSTEYKEYTIEFTTGPNSNYAWFYVYIDGNKVWVDDAKLVEVKKEEILDYTNLIALINKGDSELNKIIIGDVIGQTPKVAVDRLEKAIKIGKEILTYKELGGINIKAIKETEELLDSAIKCAKNLLVTENTGDINNDFNIDGKDLAASIKYMGKQRKVYNSDWEEACKLDFNADDRIDFRDMKILSERIIGENYKPIIKSSVTATKNNNNLDIGDKVEYIYSSEDLNKIVSNDLKITFNDKVLQLINFDSTVGNKKNYHILANGAIENEARLLLAADGYRNALKGNMDIIKLTFKVVGYGESSIKIEDRNVNVDGIENIINKTLEENLQIVDKDKIVLEKARNLISKEIRPNSITLTWDEPENKKGLESYILYKDGKEIATITSDIKEFKVEGLKENTLYGFKIVAKYSNGKISRPIAKNIRTEKLK